MKRKLVDILACPIDKYYPLELLELKSDGEEIIDGVLTCSECNRFYPIVEEIPIMLPDERRRERDDLDFLLKWRDKLPENLVYHGKPFSLQKE